MQLQPQSTQCTHCGLDSVYQRWQDCRATCWLKSENETNRLFVLSRVQQLGVCQQDVPAATVHLTVANKPMAEADYALLPFSGCNNSRYRAPQVSKQYCTFVVPALLVLVQYVYVLHQDAVHCIQTAQSADFEPRPTSRRGPLQPHELQCHRSLKLGTSRPDCEILQNVPVYAHTLSTLHV